ncbi:hypothetical protein Ancab_034905 [Ancistrocladus abbreviatus]
MPISKMADTSNPFYLSYHHEQEPNSAEYHHHDRYPPTAGTSTPDECPSSSRSFVFPPVPAPAPLSPPPFLNENVISPFRSAILSPLYSSESELELSDSEPVHVPDPHQADGFNFDYGDEKDEELREEEDDEVNFITNLFERSAEEQNSDLDIDLEMDLGQFPGYMNDSEDLNCEMVREFEGIRESNEVDLEFGLGLEASESIESETVDEEEEPRRFGGLRVVGIDSDSDSEQNEPFHCQYASDTDDFDGNERSSGLSDFDRPPFCWDYLGFNDQRSNSDTFDWEQEADDNDHDNDRETEMSGAVTDHDGNDFPFDPYEDRSDEYSREISIHSDTDEEREFRDDLEGLEELEWDAIFVEAEENMYELTGNPPAAKSVVESLPIVDLCRDDLHGNEIVCAICRDEGFNGGHCEAASLPPLLSWALYSSMAENS